MRSWLYAVLVILSIILLGASAFRPTVSDSEYSLHPDTPVAEVLERLGDPPLPHKPNFKLRGVSVVRGYDIVHYGTTTGPDGQRTTKQSPHFVCTSCHNMVREDPDLSVADPEARLDYCAAQGIPFLPGTTMYGVVNRTSFYNGDYEKKYGDLVYRARYDLREAIQLCAIACSQGRHLAPWELESVLAYFWTLQLKMGDLQLTPHEWQEVEGALAQGRPSGATIELIKSHYLQASPATFVPPPDDRRQGYAVPPGNPQRGRLIYQQSCLHCHWDKRFSFFALDYDLRTFSFLSKHIARYTRYSIYQVIRWGTEPIPGKRAYMPNFTLEKMSHQQVEDLRAFIETQAHSEQ